MLKTLKQTVALCAVLLSGIALADAPRQTLNIPAGDLARALELLAKQSGADLVYRPEQVKGLKTGGVHGELSAREAIVKLIEGTPLTLSTDATGAMLIAAPLPAASSGITSSDNRPVTQGDLRRLDHQSLLAQNTAQPQNMQKVEAPEERRAGQTNDAKEDETQQIEVTGSMLRRKNDTTPVTVIDRAEIERRGVTTAEDIIKTLPQNVNTVTSAATARADNENGMRLDFDGPFLDAVRGQAAANLRGLGTGSTLVLVNGRRTGGSAVDQGNFVNLSTIPADAVERVEILTEGASALYGADAIAGVINFILRKDYVGASSSLRAENSATGADEYKFTQTFGYSWDGGNITATAAASTRKSIVTRDIYRTNDFTSLGGLDYRATDGSGGRVYYQDNYRIIAELGGPLALPPGVSLADSGATWRIDPDWGATLDNQGAFSEALAAPFDDVGDDYSEDDKNGSISLHVSQRLSPSVDSYFELIHAVDETYRVGGYTSALLIMPTEDEVPVPGNGNTSGEWLIGSTILDFAGRNKGTARAHNTDVVLGLGWNLPWSDWRVDTSVSYLYNKVTSIQRGVDSFGAQGLSFAVFDLFGGMTPAERQQFIDLYGFVSVFRPINESRLFDGKIEGSLMHLPGGDLRLGVGTEYRDERQSFTRDQPSISEGLPGGPEGTQARDGFTHQKRTVKAAFSELLLPFVGADNGFTAVRSLQLSAGARWEQYDYFNIPENFIDLNGLMESDLDSLGGLFAGATYAPRRGQTFSHVSPRLALSWRPLRSLNLRASWAEAFRAPRTNEMIADEGTQSQPLEWRDERTENPLFRDRDPLHPDIGTTNPRGYLDWYLEVPTGNPFLRPETSNNYTYGFDWTPESIRRLQVSMSYYRIDYRDRITSSLPFTYWYTNPQTAVRDADGYLLYIRRMPLNINQRKSRSMDFNLGYSWDTGLGTLAANVNGTYTLTMDDYLRTSSGGITKIRRLKTDKGPREWQGALDLAWSRNRYGLDMFVRYFSPYLFDGLFFDYNVDATTTVDLTGHYSFGKDWDVLMGVRNVTNELTFTGQSSYVDTLAVDPRGRVMYFELKKSFNP